MPTRNGVSEAISSLCEVALGKGKHLRWDHLDDRGGTAIVMEHPVGHGEVPAALVLSAPQVGESSQLHLSFDAYRGALHHHVEALLPLVAAGRERDLGVPRDVHGFLFLETRAEVEAVLVPDGRQRCHMRETLFPNRADPEQLGRVQDSDDIRPRRRIGIWRTEAKVLLRSWFHVTRTLPIEGTHRRIQPAILVASAVSATLCE